MSDFIGLPGFIMRSAYNAAYPTQGRKQPVYLQGSRQMESTSRSYYEKNLGAGMFIAPEVEHGFMGYTEPLRRFIQPEGYTPQVPGHTGRQRQNTWSRSSLGPRCRPSNPLPRFPWHVHATHA
jgi:hypothetical protein